MIGKDLRPSEQHIRATKEHVDVLLPALRYVARSHGYALAIHGSLERDIDIVAVPWREEPTSALSLVWAIYTVCGAVTCASWPGGNYFPERKPHGRLAWTIYLGGGPYIDLSVMPRAEKA